MPSANVLEQKKQIVADLVEKLKSAQAGVIVDYRGLTVEEDTNLRRKLREAGVEYKVVKNTLTRFAANEVGLSGLDDQLNGPTSLDISADDPVAPAKVISEFAKDNEEKRQGFDVIMQHQTGKGGWTYTDAALSVTEVMRVRAESFEASRKAPKG